MAVTAKSHVQSNSLAGLDADIAAGILAGKQPVGDAFFDPTTGLYTQAMSTGDGSASEAAYAVNGALNAAGGVAYLTKAGIGAYTLAAPAYSGAVIEIISRTANAHVVTATGLIDDGVTGGAKGTMTFAAFAGASIRLRAQGGFWNVAAKNVVTVS